MARLGAGRRARVCCWGARLCTRLSPVWSTHIPCPVYALTEPAIVELLIKVVDVVLEGSGIDEKFLGVTLFALVPNTTEFMNAMSFAMNGNIALRYV